MKSSWHKVRCWRNAGHDGVPDVCMIWCSFWRIPMTTTAHHLLKVFDALPAAEQHEVAVAIFRRTATTEDLSEAALHELADELFCRYDAEEANHAKPSTQ